MMLTLHCISLTFLTKSNVIRVLNVLADDTNKLMHVTTIHTA